MVTVGPPARTDDAGEYRLIGLSPGTYYVLAALRETWTVTENGVERTMGYAPTYAPGATSLIDARRVTVAVGQSAGNTSFALMPGAAASVSGTAADSLGRPIGNRNIMLMQEFGGPTFGTMMLGGQATTAADGTFTIRNVSPGSYKLAAQTTRDTQTDRGTVLEIATQLVTLDGADVTNLSLTTSMGWAIAGTVVTDTGTVPSAPPSRFGVAARLVDPDLGGGPGGAPPPPPPPGAPGGGAIPTAAASETTEFNVVFVFAPAHPPVRPRRLDRESDRSRRPRHADTPIEMKSGETRPRAGRRLEPRDDHHRSAGRRQRRPARRRHGDRLLPTMRRNGRTTRGARDSSRSTGQVSDSGPPPGDISRSPWTTSRKDRGTIRNFSSRSGVTVSG